MFEMPCALQSSFTAFWKVGFSFEQTVSVWSVRATIRGHRLAAVVSGATLRSWAMDAESVRRVREVWSNAASQPPMLEDDDDTRTWNGYGAPAASQKVRCPLRRV